MTRREVFLPLVALALASTLGTVLGAVLLGGCKTKSELAPEAESEPKPVPGHLRLIAAAQTGDVAGAVRSALGNATREHRRLVVYVGATWCEPCQHFHEAAERGELDSTFPDLNVLVFDNDRDRDALKGAGYTSTYIPLFVLPNTDGRSSGHQVEGGVKGDAAVGFLVPRLKALLEE